MYIRKGDGPRVVTLPNGSQMTQADLPPPHTTRWVARRKRAVVLGVEAGLLTEEEAFARYDLSEEEFREWKAGMTEHGMDGLKTTMLQRRKQT